MNNKDKQVECDRRKDRSSKVKGRPDSVRRDTKKFEKSGRSGKEARRVAEAVDTIYRSEDNPVEFYNVFEQMFKDAGRIPFAVPVGARYNILRSGAPTNLQQGVRTVPGICEITWVPGIGWSQDNTSPINRSITRAMSYLRAYQKAARQYDGADMMMQMLALDSCLMWLEVAKRLYGTAFLFTPLNKYFAASVVNAQGFLYDDIKNKLAQIRSDINQFAASLEMYAVPKTQFFARHQWMCAGLYADSATTRAQLYIFRPQWFWQFDNTVTTGSQLTAQYFTPGVTWSQFYALGQGLLAAITGHADTDFISGDSLAAWGTDGILQATGMDENYRVYPSFSREVLSQIENAVFVDQVFTNNTGELVVPRITQNPAVNNGAIIFTPYARNADGNLGSILHLNEERRVNMHEDSVTTEAVMEATRLTVASSAFVDPTDPIGTTLVPIDYCGTEICVAMHLFGAPSDTFQSGVASVTNSVQVPFNAPGTTRDALQAIGVLSNFDWHPLFTTYQQVADGGDYLRTGDMWDADNVTALSLDDLAQLHDTALYSEFDVPTPKGIS